MSTYRKRVNEDALLPPHGSPPLAEYDRLPCRLCNAATQRETLTDYGARCFRCFEAWQNERHEVPDIGDRTGRGLRDWAHALKRRHDAGERLTPAQVAAYKAALRTYDVEAVE
jgi:hypothetical protein